MLFRSSIRLSICPSARSSVSLSVRQSVCASARPSVNPSVRQSVRPTIRLCVRPSARSSVHPFVRPSVCTSVYPSVRPFVGLFVRLVGPSCPDDYHFGVCPISKVFRPPVRSSLTREPVGRSAVRNDLLKCVRGGGGCPRQRTSRFAMRLRLYDCLNYSVPTAGVVGRCCRPVCRRPVVRVATRLTDRPTDRLTDRPVGVATAARRALSLPNV